MGVGEVLSINVQSSTSVIYPTNGTTLSFQTDFTFVVGSEYYVLLDPGKYFGLVEYVANVY